MDELINFPKKQVDSNLEKVWEVICERIRIDFTSVGFTQYIDDFKKDFRPIFEQFTMDPVELPDFKGDKNFSIWEAAVNKTLVAFKNHNAKLLNERYTRELEIFYLLKILPNNSE